MSEQLSSRERDFGEDGGFGGSDRGCLRRERTCGQGFRYWVFASLAFPVGMLGSYACGLGTGFAAGVVLGQVHSVEGIKVSEGCNTLVLEHHWMPGGLTLPTGDKRSLILIYDKRRTFVSEGGKYGKQLNHELGHAEQVCEDGEGMEFIMHWLSDRKRYEDDADGRMMKRDYEGAALGTGMRN